MSKKNLEKIYFKALNKVKAKSIIKDNISLEKNILTISNGKIDLNKFNNLYIFGVGKAAFSMAKECENIIGKKIKGGFIISTSKGNLNYLKHFTSTHPDVTTKSEDAANKLIDNVKKLKKNDYFIFLLSGGASAMIEKPILGLSLEDFIKASSSLLTSGIDIKALNTIRKSISQVKGGKLADCIKSNGKVLVLSDVIGDDLNIIGSAPMNNGKFQHILVGNNEIALNEAKKFCKKDYEKVEIITTTLDYPSKKASKYVTKLIKEYDKKYSSFVLLFGGETTTVVKSGGGYGGRNQELALRLLLENVVNEDISILCAGSDGIDGRSDANGAFVTFKTIEKMNEMKLNPKEFLENSDSNTFFKKLGFDFVTGITGTNVMDFIIIEKKGR
ncbi:glycerate kinase type-2 family protein [Arcobacter arenosus]|uniref:glycerate kinase type-2 family protein n=1 Tax=Arcobacter arenosus TaxID=2576037 RepID=UPI003BA8FC8E